ncbi:MAG: hypothetical protein RQ750_01750 [Roseovarius sp.]|nr:hypothetical protein [Roseovarius sp.]
MSKARRYITAGGTLVCALGIGYFMQAGDPGPGAQSAAIIDAGDPAVEISQITLTSAAPTPPVAMAEPAALPAEPVTLAVAVDVGGGDNLPAEESVPTLACEYTMTAEPLAAAMVKITLDAPCMNNEKFTLHQNGMMFTEATDENGHRELSVPALGEKAVFIASFGNGEGAIATATVDSFSFYDRFVVQWGGTGGIKIHALEYGADFGDQGHVWDDAAYDMARAARGEGGFLTRHGSPSLDNALLAEVYTFPTETALRAGDVSLRVEAEVTAANCGRDLEAQTIATDRTGGLKVQDIVLAMPDCEGIGDFLVLKNLFNDLKVAQN